ncbi:Crp/Fnr family transcriptional regulator [Pseudomonas agarici]|uniref:Crp/Fnr family transcriptional regulator n=1 Tax=Pseudomonas agarici TaxID=46677 RepID=A0A0X1T3L6_PSEAA|nr:Crp/Fnr family transcriptional regulator [Pseudomonas agarici]AMB86648.1 Crp/Fnr family transcriptional regulator [Pseudomonas agarici]
MDVSAWRSRLLTGHWFSNLPAYLQDSLLVTAKGRRLTPGQCLFKRGDPPCGLYAVLEGSVRVGAVSAKNKVAPPSRIELPYWFGEISLFDGLPRTHDAYAVGHTILLHVRQSVLLELLQEHPEYWRHFALLMSQKLCLTFIGLEQLSRLPATVRLAHWLLLIAEGYGELNQSRQLIPLAQDQLAAMLSLSRQSSRQIFQGLQDEGIIELNRGEIEILDLERLRAAASA